MKILLISRGWPTKKDPKWGCFEKDQAEALKALGHDVKVLCIDCRFSFKPYIPGIKRTTINDIDYISFRGLPQVVVALMSGNKNAIKLEQWMLSKIYKILLSDGYQPDVVYSHFVLNSSAAAVLKKKYDLPFVAIEHSSELVKDKLTGIIEAQAIEAYKSADKLISVSDYLKRRLKERFGVDSEVVPNMLGPEFILSDLQKRQNQTGKVRFISVGALIPRKGYIELIEAFSKANIDREKWQLDIIGYGDLRKTINNQIERMGLSENINLLGPKTKTEIIKIMVESDVFVLNTKKETFGVVYIEALSQGLPCIATECGGAEGIIGDEDGINIKVSDENSLVEAIEYMYYNYRKYNSNEIRLRNIQKYSPEKVVKSIEKILLEVISR